MKSEINHGSRLHLYFKEQQDRIMDFIRWLVEQESMSLVPEAATQLAENLGNRFSQLGAIVDLVRDQNCGATVRARFYPEAPGHTTTSVASRKTGELARDGQVLVVGHLDTVWPIGTLAKRPFRIDGDWAFGPGIFDMKAGLALVVFALDALAKFGHSPARPVTLLITCDEETGSHYTRDLIEQEGARSRVALVLEPPIPGGKVKTGRKGVGEFELIIQGKSAHAGGDPYGGVSAITEMANQILAVNRLADRELGTTLNVGVVSGGVLSNVIPAKARALIDVRYGVPEEGERIVERMAALSPTLQGARLEVRGGINRPPLVRTPEIAGLFEHARSLAAEIDYDLNEGAVGGASDGNFLAAMGVPVLDGLGVDGAGAHAEHEHIILSDIPRRATLLTRLIQTLSA